MSTRSKLAPTVAIAGGTGKLGSRITEALLAQVSHLRELRILTSRTPPSFVPKGATFAKLDYDDDSSIAEVLNGVDVVVNVLGGHDAESYETKRKLLKGIIKNGGVQLYFPSEFGIDHRKNDFRHPEWDAKKAHQDYARLNGPPGMKTCAIYVGLFIEESFGPWFGFDTKNCVYTSCGQSTTPVTYTALQDVGKAVASLILNNQSYRDIPDHVTLSGSTISMRDAAKLMSSINGKSIDVREIALEEYKKKMTSNEASVWIRLLMGDGRLDLSKHERNEIVNPGEKEWKWKTVEEYAREIDGKPWVD